MHEMWPVNALHIMCFCFSSCCSPHFHHGHRKAHMLAHVFSKVSGWLHKQATKRRQQKPLKFASRIFRCEARVGNINSYRLQHRNSDSPSSSSSSSSSSSPSGVHIISFFKKNTQWDCNALPGKKQRTTSAIQRGQKHPCLWADGTNQVVNITKLYLKSLILKKLGTWPVITKAILCCIYRFPMHGQQGGVAPRRGTYLHGAEPHGHSIVGKMMIDHDGPCKNCRYHIFRLPDRSKRSKFRIYSFLVGRI